MKKLLALAAAITLLCTAALAEFDFYALKDTPDAMTYTVPGTADTVVRPALAPYQGEFGEDELVAYLDYIILPDEEVATFRLCLSLSMFDSFQADEVRVTVDKKCYTFAVKPAITDYDGIFMEDYTLVLSSESFSIVTGAVEGEKRHDDAGRIRQHDGRRRAGRQRGDSQRGRANPADPLQRLRRQQAGFVRADGQVPLHGGKSKISHGNSTKSPPTCVDRSGDCVCDGDRCGIVLSLHRHAAERRHLLQLIQRERRTGERLRRQRHQQQRVIIRRDAVGVNRAAHPAAMEQRPFAVFVHPHADGFHQRAAVGFAVAGGVVEVNGAQAVRAMVAVVTARAFGNDEPSAVPAGEGFVAGVGLVVVFVVEFPLVFAVHGEIPPDIRR